LDYSAEPIVGGRLTTFYMLVTAIASFFTSGLLAASSAAVFYRLARHWAVGR